MFLLRGPDDDIDCAFVRFSNRSYVNYEHRFIEASVLTGYDNKFWGFRSGNHFGVSTWEIV